jgi:hypothetical protein
MNLTDFAEAGASIVAIAAITIITIKVLTYIAKRDGEFLAHIEKKDQDFKEVITNHISHANATMNNLEKAVRELIIVLKSKK